MRPRICTDRLMSLTASQAANFYFTHDKGEYMQMNPYLYFDGDCEAALKF